MLDPTSYPCGTAFWKLLTSNEVTLYSPKAPNPLEFGINDGFFDRGGAAILIPEMLPMSFKGSKSLKKSAVL